jgi:hypothetical protein
LIGRLLLARSHPWAGLVLVLAAIVIDAVFWNPLVMWTIAAFTVFAMTLSGASVIGTGSQPAQFLSALRCTPTIHGCSTRASAGSPA